MLIRLTGERRQDQQADRKEISFADLGIKNIAVESACYTEFSVVRINSATILTRFGVSF